MSDFPIPGPGRSYRQYCAVARALDLVGERWSLLIVRELLGGPRRYSDLQAGLPGIATDMLATRLRTLEQGGLIRRRELGPPAPAKLYELTPRGTELDGVLVELARWGRPLLAPGPGEAAFQPEWLALAMRSLCHPGRLQFAPVLVSFESSDWRLILRVGAGECHTLSASLPGMGRDARGLELPADEPPVDVRIRGEPGVLAALARGDLDAPRAIADGQLTVSGRLRAIVRVVRAFDLASQSRRT